MKARSPQEGIVRFKENDKLNIYRRQSTKERAFWRIIGFHALHADNTSRLGLMDKKLCYLCGRKADTVDHIPPRSFFPKPWPDNLLTVPCCNACNNKLSPIDEQMRVFLAADENANEGAKKIQLQKIFKENSIKGKPFRTVAATLKSFPIILDGSLQTGHILSAKTKDLYYFVERVIRGLACKYYADFYEPKDFVLVECISSARFKEAKNANEADAVFKYLSRIVPGMNHDCFGEGILDFFHQRAGDDGTGWVVSFYRGATFMGSHAKKDPCFELRSEFCSDKDSSLF